MAVVATLQVFSGPAGEPARYPSHPSFFPKCPESLRAPPSPRRMAMVALASPCTAISGACAGLRHRGANLRATRRTPPATHAEEGVTMGLVRRNAFRVLPRDPRGCAAAAVRRNASRAVRIWLPARPSRVVGGFSAAFRDFLAGVPLCAAMCSDARAHGGILDLGGVDRGEPERELLDRDMESME